MYQRLAFLYPHRYRKRYPAQGGALVSMPHSLLTRGYRKRYPAHERKTPRINALPSSALLGIENDTHRTREKKSCINALPSSTLIGIENDTHHSKEGTPPSTHPQVSKTIPITQKRELTPPCPHRYRKRYPAEKGNTHTNSSPPFS